MLSFYIVVDNCHTLCGIFPLFNYCINVFTAMRVLSYTMHVSTTRSCLSTLHVYSQFCQRCVLLSLRIIHATQCKSATHLSKRRYDSILQSNLLRAQRCGRTTACMWIFSAAFSLIQLQQGDLIRLCHRSSRVGSMLYRTCSCCTRSNISSAARTARMSSSYCQSSDLHAGVIELQIRSSQNSSCRQTFRFVRHRGMMIHRGKIDVLSSFGRHKSQCAVQDLDLQAVKAKSVIVPVATIQMLKGVCAF